MITGREEPVIASMSQSRKIASIARRSQPSSRTALLDNTATADPYTGRRVSRVQSHSEHSVEIWTVKKDGTGSERLTVSCALTYEYSSSDLCLGHAPSPTWRR